MPSASTPAIYQLKITLRKTKPPIWRRLLIPEDTTLARVHDALQILFNWTDSHLHEFRAGHRTFGMPDPDDLYFGREVLNERKATLSDLAKRVGDKFEYVYDFGDDWQHTVLLEDKLAADPQAIYPLCIGGKRSGPPEDVGGPFGYANYLEAISDSEHEQHDDMVEWGGPFDPEAFSLKEINASLISAFRKSARKRS